MNRPSWMLERLRDGDDPVSRRLRRFAGSVPVTYAAYALYGRLRPELAHPLAGADATEPLPGDELVAHPELAKTFAVDIAAAPDVVWPFLVQMGYGRAGWYTWYPFDNGGVDSAEEILPEHQAIAVGDVLPDGPDAGRGFGCWEVRDVRDRERLVLFSRREALSGREVPDGEPLPGPTYECSWVFVVRPTPRGSQLVVRVRARAMGFTPGLFGRAARRMIDAGDTVMEWTMLHGIKARAERVHRARRPRRTSHHPVVDGLRGAAVIAAGLVTPFARRSRSVWGMDEQEAARERPGDELVPEPGWGWTHAIEIDAPAEDVWPWIAQIGADRGGFYSYEWLENVAGCGLANAEQVHPEWEVKVGDGLLLHPKMPRLPVVRVEPGCYFLAHVAPDPAAVTAGAAWAAVSWLFVVEATGPDRCRLISRYRAACSDDLATRLAFGPPLLEPISFAMDRRMLQGVKERAERRD